MSENPYEPSQELASSEDRKGLSPFFWIVATIAAIAVAFPAFKAIYFLFVFRVSR
jgi:hypothetical protein